ncbi:MAG: c-type cytochrome [Burkholderiales bacterium]|nr:c-type cytochrome [Burkholderiales bacterium]
MSEVKIEEHSSPIKTPKQLIIVLVLAFVVPIALIVMLTQLVIGSARFGKDHPGMSDEAIAKRLKPVGDVVVSDPNAPKIEKTGQQVVETVCAACHATGALNAPKIGDKAAWAKLIGEGQEKVTQDALKGIRQMPPRGGNPDLTDTEFARAVAYMANQAGASWKEPESKPAPASKPAVTAAAPAAPTAAPAAASAKADASKGKAVYEANCVACHAAGVAGAPKAGDKTAWAPRIKSGMDALYTAALKGKNAMPPKGGNSSLADADVKAAVDYLVGLVK